MPMAAFGNFDVLTHKTVEDLVYCAQHELDMWNEGEETDIQTINEANAVRRWIARWSKAT